MQEKLQKKFFIPLLIMAIVAIGGSAYTFNHAGPYSAHAQTVVSQHVSDKETLDDAVVPTTIQKVQEGSNQQDSRIDGETQDGNWFEFNTKRNERLSRFF